MSKMDDSTQKTAAPRLEDGVIEVIEVAAQPDTNTVYARLAFAVVVVLLVCAVGIHTWLGKSLKTPTHATAADQIAAMVERLKGRLRSTPEDVEGWAMLGRSYLALGKHAESVQAHRKVVELSPQNAQGYADLADALGAANGRSLEGEPEQAIAKALSLDPGNVKALALAGMLAFNRGDPARAAREWELALRHAQPNDPMVNQLRRALAQARHRANLPAAAGSEK